VEGDFYNFSDYNLQIWVPSYFQEGEIGDEEAAAGIIGYMTTSDGAYSMVIQDVDVSGMSVDEYAEALAQVEGVSGMMTNLGGSVTDLMNNKKNAQKGAKAVKVEKTDDGLEMELYITVGYGHPVLEVAESAQKAVKSSIEAMTGCTVSAINIHVGGVTMDA
jgi:uncharacterized alkaline shock family protein YloU